MSRPRSQPVATLAAAARRWWPAAALAATALAVFPAAAAPFSQPKIAALCVAAGGALALSLASRGRPAAGAWLCGLAWLAAIALSALHGEHTAPWALAREGAAALLFVSLAQLGPARRPTLRAAALLGTLVSVVALAQAAGFDPLASWSPRAPGRLAVYSTLGNPDFVAAFVAPTLCITMLRRGPGWPACALLQACALATARSFATLLALTAAAGVAWILRERRAAVALALLCALLWLPVQKRSLPRVAAGRLHLARVALTHAGKAPLLGWGPGSFAALQPAWDAGEPQDHVHCDWLERWLEGGATTALAFAALTGCALTAALGRRRADLACPLAALTARSLVDFPLSRPAELCLFVVLIALACRSRAAPASLRKEAPCRELSAPSSP